MKREKCVSHNSIYLNIFYHLTLVSTKKKQQFDAKHLLIIFHMHTFFMLVFGFDQIFTWSAWISFTFFSPRPLSLSLFISSCVSFLLQSNSIECSKRTEKTTRSAGVGWCCFYWTKDNRILRMIGGIFGRLCLLHNIHIRMFCSCAKIVNIIRK